MVSGNIGDAKYSFLINSFSYIETATNVKSDIKLNLVFPLPPTNYSNYYLTKLIFNDTNYEFNPPTNYQVTINEKNYIQYITPYYNINFSEVYSDYEKAIQLGDQMPYVRYNWPTPPPRMSPSEFAVLETISKYDITYSLLAYTPPDPFPNMIHANILIIDYCLNIMANYIKSKIKNIPNMNVNYDNNLKNKTLSLSNLAIQHFTDDVSLIQKQINTLKSSLNVLIDSLIIFDLIGGNGYVTGKSLITDNVGLQIYSTKEFQNQINVSLDLSLSVIDLTNCIPAIRNALKLNSTDPLMIKKIDWSPSISPQFAYATNSVFFELYLFKTNEKVDLSICNSSDNRYIVKIPINTKTLPEDVNLALYQNVAQSGYDIFNKLDPFFSDRCSIFVNANTDSDVSINIRRQIYYQGYSIACLSDPSLTDISQSKCSYIGMDTFNYIWCSCTGYSEAIAVFNPDPMPLAPEANGDVLGCPNLGWQRLISRNVGFLVPLFIIFGLLAIGLIYFFIDRKLIENHLNSYIKNDCRYIRDKDKPEVYFGLNKVKNSTDSDRNTNNDNEHIIIKSNNASLNQKNNFEDIRIESDREEQKLTIKPVGTGKKLAKEIDLEKERSEEEESENERQNMIIDFSAKRDDEVEDIDLNINENKNEKKINIPINIVKETITNIITRKIEEKKEVEIDIELAKKNQEKDKNIKKNENKKDDDNNIKDDKNEKKTSNNFMEPDFVLKEKKETTIADIEVLEGINLILYDNRSFCAFYYDWLKETHSIISFFFYMSLLKPRIVKFFAILLEFSMIFLFDALLMNDNYIEKSISNVIVFYKFSIPLVLNGKIILRFHYLQC